MVNFIDSREQFRPYWTQGTGSIVESTNYFNPNKATNIQYRHAFVNNRPQYTPDTVVFRPDTVVSRRVLPAGDLTGMNQARYNAPSMVPVNVPGLSIGDIVGALLDGIKNVVFKILSLLGLYNPMIQQPQQPTTEVAPVSDNVPPPATQAQVQDAPALTSRQKPAIYHPWTDPIYDGVPTGFQYHTMMFSRQIIK